MLDEQDMLAAAHRIGLDADQGQQGRDDAADLSRRISASSSQDRSGALQGVQDAHRRPALLPGV